MMPMLLPASPRSPRRRLHRSFTMQPTGYPQLDALLPRLAALASLEADALHAERIAILGRKQGALTFALRALPTFAPEERKRFGAEANRLKEAFEAAFAAREGQLSDLTDRTAPTVGPTRPRPRPAPSGRPEL